MYKDLIILNTDTCHTLLWVNWSLKKTGKCKLIADKIKDTFCITYFLKHSTPY
jgi:hypothetical protein